MRKWVWIGVALCFSVMLTACSGKPGHIRMATGETTGNYYAFGSAAGQVFSEKTGIPIDIWSTTGSRQNIRLVNTGDVDIAIVQNDVMDYAWKGTEDFRGEKVTGFSAVGALYAEVCHLVVNPASGIKSISDVRGKNISVGDVGGASEINARQIVESYGIRFEDFNKHNLGFGASADALREGRIDAFFCVAGAPVPAVANLAAVMDVEVMELNGLHADMLIRSYPFYARYTIPAGTYRGQVSDINTVAVKATLIARSSLSDNTVYRLTQALFEGKDQIEALHFEGSSLSASYAVEGVPSVPFHPGAAKYFKKVGVLR